MSGTSPAPMVSGQIDDRAGEVQVCPPASRITAGDMSLSTSRACHDVQNASIRSFTDFCLLHD